MLHGYLIVRFIVHICLERFDLVDQEQLDSQVVRILMDQRLASALSYAVRISEHCLAHGYEFLHL